MSSRISLFNKAGQYLAEVDATCNRTYKLNEFGTATFTISTSDSKCREDYLRFGNYIYVEHDKLPIWVGMIDTPRIWKHGAVEVTAYSAEYICTCMITHSAMPVSGTPGNIFVRLVSNLFDNMKSGADYKNIKLGDIYGGGAVLSRSYSWNGTYNEITKLCKDTRNDFYFEPYIDDYGKLNFYAHWYEKRGMKSTFVLYEDTNIKLSNTPLREQGRIANDILIFGPGATPKARPTGKVWDTESVDRYGLRWMVQAAQGTDLTTEANAALIEHSTPRKTFDITVIDIGDTFYHCRVGDQLPVVFHSVGFQGDGLGTNETIRILQMDYQEDNNQLKLVADQVKE